MWWLLLACQEPAQDTSAPQVEAAPVLPSAYDYTPSSEAAAPLSYDALALAAQHAIDRPLQIDPLDAANVMDRALDWALPECPTRETVNGMDFFHGDCTTADGVQTYGFAQRARMAGGYVWGVPHRQFAWQTGSMEILAPDGPWMFTRGDARYRDFDDPDYGVPSFEGYLWGDFGADIYGFQDRWVAENLSLDLLISARRWDRLVEELTIDGSIDRMSGELRSVRFEGNHVSERSGDCAAEPTGSIAFRDQAGLWYTVTFEGGEGATGAACDGCGALSGPASATGESEVESGVLCLDFSGWTAWEDRPW